jgi:hypothetical protein
MTTPPPDPFSPATQVADEPNKHTITTATALATAPFRALIINWVP